MPESAANFNHNQPVYSVSEVSFSIKRMVEDHFGVVRIRGEISGFKAASSGHVYFRLKDDNAVMDAVCWRGTASKLPFKAEDGLEVICTGKITTYPGKSSYQIVVDRMEPAGVGALMALLEKRRKMFEAEGLFDPTRKRPLPFLPAVVGVITSPTGAVIRDILHRIAERFPMHVIVWPVAVQGEAAAGQVAAAIEGFNAMAADGIIPIPDVLIVARGGGSIEDLWAFNEEIVVRAAAASRIALISAVGHETDTTLIDYVSDRRAPTPTAAAEMAVPVRDELALGLKQLDARLSTALQRSLAQRQELLQGMVRGLPKPMQLLQTATQRLDDWSERLLTALPANLMRKEQQLSVLAAGLRPQILLGDIAKSVERLGELDMRLVQAMQRGLNVKQDRLGHMAALLESVNYHKVLERGFALVKNAQGQVITSAGAAKAEQELSIVFRDGDIQVRKA
jgi:exodeoxyribonuclease VII large subunit